MIIYKTINKINGKYYIGKDEKNNPNYLGSGLLLNRAIYKYGRKNFEKTVLEICETKEQLNEREIFWITELSATTFGYNIALGGSGGDTYTNNPNLSKIKEKFVGSNNHFYGKKHSEKTKRKISESQKGRKPWNEGKKGVYTEEYINKLSKIRKDKYSGKNHPRFIEIDKGELEIQLKNKTIKEIAEHFKVSVSCIRRKISDYNLDVIKKSGNFEKPLDKKIIKKIFELREKGLSIVKISNTVGVCVNKINKILKQSKNEKGG